MRPGPRNLITDVARLRVGNAEDHAIKTAGVSSSDPMTLPHDALLILDNADDPYKLKNDDGWFEKRFLPELDAWGCTILMTMRYACPAHILAPLHVGSYPTQRSGCVRQG